MPELFSGDPLPDCVFDIAVIGTGVVGCATARRFTLEGANVVIMDKAADILDGASKANSAILHTGYDAPAPGSQEHHCITRGYAEYMQIYSKLNLPLLECGAMVLAWNQQQAGLLEGNIRKAHENGITSARMLTASQVRAREPQLASIVVAGMEIPGESVIDPWSAPYAYLLQAIENGATLVRHCKLLGGQFSGGKWLLNTSRGNVRARHVINCAGLYGDLINRMLTGSSDFEIRPRKGQFIVYDKSARGLIRSILLPVPSEITKGIVVCPTIFGNLLVGPTAEEQHSRENADVETAILEKLVTEGKRILPALENHAITGTYAGIRPATEHRDYQIKWQHDLNYCCVGGIRSTGLSASLGIAALVFEQYADAGNLHAVSHTIHWPEPAAIAENMKRDWQRPGNRGIVCHCELVTRREIDQALNGSIAPATLAGLKRRTRVTMGRCQGFYCSAELSEMTRGFFSQPLAEPCQ